MSNARRVEEHRAHSAARGAAFHDTSAASCLGARGGAAIGAAERVWCLARVSARADVRSIRMCSWSHGRVGVDRQRLPMACCCAHFFDGVGCRRRGCVVRSRIQLAAIYFVMPRLVRRENAPSELGLSQLCIAHAGGGRCLRRSRAPRARRGRRQRVQDAHGVCCGRCGGGSGLVSGSYSDFRVGKFSFAF